VSGQGGAVETSAARVNIKGGAQVKTLSKEGSGGRWLIDPGDFSILPDNVPSSGSSISAKTLEDNLRNSPNSVITVQTINTPAGQGGDLYLLAPLRWENTTLKLAAYRNIFINEDMNVGDKAGLILATARVSGVKGDYFLSNAKINLAGNASFQTISGSGAFEQVTNYKIITTIGTSPKDPGSLWSMSRTDNHVLGQDMDASDTRNWNAGRGFLSKNNMLAFLMVWSIRSVDFISGLYIRQFADDPPVSGAGLFASTNATASIRNLGLVDAEVNAPQTAGIVVGKNLGSILNVYSTGKVSGAEKSGIDLGGLVGEHHGGIGGSWSSANVTGVQALGGLVGLNQGDLITDSYATGNVSGSLNQRQSL
jgi:hypothetical protein